MRFHCVIIRTSAVLFFCVDSCRVHCFFRPDVLSPVLSTPASPRHTKSPDTKMELLIMIIGKRFFFFFCSPHDFPLFRNFFPYCVWGYCSANCIAVAGVHHAAVFTSDLMMLSPINPRWLLAKNSSLI